MIRFEEFVESTSVVAYHGDNFGLTEVNGNYSRMYSKNSNVQEGIGIYFSTNRETAKGYGSKVAKTTINTNKLLPSRSPIGRVVNKVAGINLLKELNKNSEEFWMILTDYGYEVEDSKEATRYLPMLWEQIKEEQVRNVQIELLQACKEDTKLFVEAWLKTTRKYGTYNKDIQFYALMKNDSEIVVG